MTRAQGVLSTVLVVLLAMAGPAAAGEAAATRKVAVQGGGAYTDVNAPGLKAMMARKDFLLVNVHIPYEGELGKTDDFVPFNRIQDNLGKLPARKDAKIVLYCRSGHMSEIAARALVKRGYTDVWNLQGGMIAWEDAGYEVTHRRR